MHSPLPNRKRDFKNFIGPPQFPPQHHTDARMTFVEHLRSPVIEVVMGKNESRFNVHKSLAMEKSALFRDHFMKRPNANLRAIHFAIVEDGRHFEPFIFWMYNEHGNVMDTGMKAPYHFGQLWMLAEEIESTEYRNFLADTIQRLDATAEWYVKSYDELVSVGRARSVMGNFLVECLAYKVAKQGWKQLIGSEATSAQAGQWFGSRQHLLHRLLLSSSEIKSSEDPREIYDCTLHLHDSEDEQENCPRYGKQEVNGPTEPVKSEDSKNAEDHEQKRARIDGGYDSHSSA